VRAVASRPHNLGHPGELERAAAHIEAALEGMGYAVRRQPFSAGGQEVRNIEAVVEPAAAIAGAGGAAETLVVGAHYDSCFDAPGANDNGTGVAAVLELARLLADLRGEASLSSTLANSGKTPTISRA
jgi:hypothetical protein